MNKYLHRTFDIKDRFGRTWGSFSVQKVFNGNIHGQLHPASDFDSVRQIFIEHERAVESGIGDTETTTAAIVDLGAYVTDGCQKFSIGSIIFISSQLLVTCRIEGLL